MRKYCFDFCFVILLFLFCIFALSNIGFIFHLSINYFYLIISFLICEIYLFKSGNFFVKNVFFILFFILSLVFSMFFIDTSFDGRCYHFTIENLLRYGYNPIYDNIYEFSSQHNIFYNLVFANSYPNAIETLRSNFYLVFNNMQSSKTANFLLVSGAFFYTLYFLNRKLNKTKTFILAFSIFSLSVLITQINTKMADFSVYCIFILQIFSLILMDKKNENKLNKTIFILSSILSVAVKYTGVLNTFILIVLYFIFKRKKEFLKTTAIIIVSSFILCFQPYVTNTIKFKNPFYPSIGYNKLDFMTGQNPREFENKPYLYKFVRSMFSSSSDSRMNNPETPPIFWKVPFTTHFDMPFIQEELRISGFGHLFSGIFLISLILSFYLMIKKKKTRFLFSAIFLTTLLNPICWWARFVPQLHLLPCMCCYYFRKNNKIFYILSFLILFNGFMILKENYLANAYNTYVMNSFYNNLYETSKTKKILIYKTKTPEDEDDETIIERLKEYGIDFEVVEQKTDDFKMIKEKTTISKNYFIKY